MMRTLRVFAGLALVAAVGLVALAGCSDDETESTPASGGTGGSTPDGSAGGSAGQAGAAGNTAGAAGEAGQAGAAGAAGAPQLGVADPKQSTIHGKSAADWAEAYWKWLMTGGTEANADQGDVYFVSLPQGADPDPNDTNNIMAGQLDLKVPAGKPLVLPLVAWTTESYEADSGTPEDLPLHDACFNPSLDPRECVAGTMKGHPIFTYVTLDGKQVAVNQGLFYTGYKKWATPVTYPEATDYGSVAATGAQTILVIIEPLPAGEHTVTNYVDFGTAGFFFDNAWKLTAEDKGSATAPGPLADESRPAVETGIADPTAAVEGKTTPQWFNEYWRWLLGGADEAANQASPVMFMPMPQGEDKDPADDVTWSQGHLDVTVPAGKPFILPVEAWMLERYEGDSGTPDDQPMADACHDPALDPRACVNGPLKYDTARVYVTLDGKQILADQSKFYFEPQPFDPVISYPGPTNYGSVAAIAVQGVGFIVEPLSAGTHELTLFVDFGPIGNFVYDNSWTITVQ